MAIYSNPITITTGTGTTGGGGGSWTITPNVGTGISHTWINTTMGGPQYSEHECGIHDLTYKAIRPGCPLCDKDREVVGLRDALKKATNQLELTSNKLRQMEAAWDFTIAMKEAAELLNDNDLAFFKQVLYLWRDEKSTALKTTYGYADKKKKSANGFIVMTRGEEPWGYACTSIGGLAICAYFEEAAGSRGAQQAMAILTRALSEHLPGSLDESGHSAS